MSVATFSPPIKATQLSNSLPCIIIAIEENTNEGDVFVAINTDGRPIYLESHEFTFDFRYDPATQLWSDPNEQAADFGDEE